MLPSEPVCPSIAQHLRLLPTLSPVYLAVSEPVSPSLCVLADRCVFYVTSINKSTSINVKLLGLWNWWNCFFLASKMLPFKNLLGATRHPVPHLQSTFIRGWLRPWLDWIHFTPGNNPLYYTPKLQVLLHFLPLPISGGQHKAIAAQFVDLPSSSAMQVTRGTQAGRNLLVYDGPEHTELVHSQKFLTCSSLCVAQPGRVREPTADRGRWSPQRSVGIHCSGRSWRKKISPFLSRELSSARKPFLYIYFPRYSPPSLSLWMT